MHDSRKLVCTALMLVLAALCWLAFADRTGSLAHGRARPAAPAEREPPGADASIEAPALADDARADPNTRRTAAPQRPGRFDGRALLHDELAAARRLFELELRGAAGSHRLTWSDARLEPRLTAEDVPPGRYAIAVRRGPGDRADGDVSAQWTVASPPAVTVTPGLAASVDIELVGRAPAPPVGLADLVGRVLVDGRPAEGLLLDVLPTSDAMTDVGARGWFVLDGVPAGRRLLVVRSDQLTSGRADLHVVYASRILDLVAGERRTLEIRLRSGGISGRVRDASDRPVEGARIALRGRAILADPDELHALPFLETSSDPRGEFAFERLPLGIFEVSATLLAGSPGASAQVELSADRPAARPVLRLTSEVGTDPAGPTEPDRTGFRDPASTRRRAGR